MQTNVYELVVKMHKHREMDAGTRKEEGRTFVLRKMRFHGWPRRLNCRDCVGGKARKTRERNKMQFVFGEKVSENA